MEGLQDVTARELLSTAYRVIDWLTVYTQTEDNWWQLLRWIKVKFKKDKNNDKHDVLHRINTEEFNQWHQGSHSISPTFAQVVVSVHWWYLRYLATWAGGAAQIPSASEQPPPKHPLHHRGREGMYTALPRGPDHQKKRQTTYISLLLTHPHREVHTI